MQTVLPLRRGEPLQGLLRHRFEQPQTVDRLADPRRGEHAVATVEGTVGQLYQLQPGPAQGDAAAVGEEGLLLLPREGGPPLAGHAGGPLLVQLGAVGGVRQGAAVVVAAGEREAHQHR